MTQNRTNTSVETEQIDEQMLQQRRSKHPDFEDGDN